MFLFNVLLISFYVHASITNYLDGLKRTELVLTFLVHRHGDRSPLKEFQYLSEKPELLEKIVAPFGYGQLTDLGKLRAYELGKFIRSRYSDYLSPKYNHSEIYIRSTDSTRTKMTVLVAMAAVYRPVGRGWSEDINWVPVPYTTVPLRYDFTNIGLHPPPSIQKMMPDIKEAADKAFDLLFGNDTMLPLQSGLLLREFFEVTALATAGKSTQKVRIYSAHDNNVYAFAAISKAIPRQGIPPYAGLFALELRRVVETGNYVVLPVYVKSPGEQVQYLEIQGCGGPLCDLKKFYAITSPYLLDVNEWKERCNYD